MRFNLISNLENGAGLQQDYQLLRKALETRGHQVRGIQFNTKPLVVIPADVNVFLETVVPQIFPAASQQWVIPNPEWWLPQYQVCLHSISKFLCKTRDSLRLFTELAGKRAEYLGFMSRDLYRPEVERQRSFLHVTGNSAVKNTEAVLMAWPSLPYELTLVTRVPKLLAMGTHVPRVTVRRQVSESELITLVNQHLFHLCPSQYEGFGHSLHEAMSVGAVVITRTGPPMDEWGILPELLVPSWVSARLRLADMRTVSAASIVKTVQYAAQLSQEKIRAVSQQMRQTFETNRASFQQRLSEVLG